MRKCKNDTAMIYCDNRKCPKMDCIRRIQYGPYGEILKVAKYNLKLADKCEEFLSLDTSMNTEEKEETVGFVQESNGQMSLF